MNSNPIEPHRNVEHDIAEREAAPDDGFDVMSWAMLVLAVLCLIFYFCARQ